MPAVDTAAWNIGGRPERLIHQQGPWWTVGQVELATLKRVLWSWNHQRLRGELDMPTPAKIETAYHAHYESGHPAPAGQGSR